MNNKQLGRKFTVENINAQAAREAIALVEGFPATKLVNASDAEVIELFEALSRNMKDEAVSELIENYEEVEKALKIENTGVWHYEHQNELDEAIAELEENPDFELFTIAQDLEQIIGEFEYQGVDIDKLIEMTTNHYGDIVEIIFDHVSNEYLVYTGAR